MHVLAHDLFGLGTDGAVAKSSAFGTAGDDSNV
jgi:hypothetical protein